MRAEDPRPEPDIEWLGLAADSDGRSIVARSYRDIANAILADQSGANQRSDVARSCRDIANVILAARAAPIRAKRGKGTSRRGYYRAQFESAWARYCAAGVTPSQPSNVAYIGKR